MTVRTGNTFNPAVLRLAEVDVSDMRTEENISSFIGMVKYLENYYSQLAFLKYYRMPRSDLDLLIFILNPTLILWFIKSDPFIVSMFEVNSEDHLEIMTYMRIKPVPNPHRRLIRI